jgi:hypothetical protein
LILRRFPNEAIEIVRVADTTAPKAGRTIGRISSHPEGETQIYGILLAVGHQIKPVDWRRFAYDDARVKELLATCIHDNVESFVFEPASADLKQRVETQIAAALQDLTSIFDPKSVHCDFGKDVMQITVTGATKNEESHSIIVNEDTSS